MRTCALAHLRTCTEHKWQPADAPKTAWSQAVAHTPLSVRSTGKKLGAVWTRLRAARHTTDDTADATVDGEAQRDADNDGEAAFDLTALLRCLPDVKEGCRGEPRTRERMPLRVCECMLQPACACFFYEQMLLSVCTCSRVYVHAHVCMDMLRSVYVLLCV
eukprot:5613312-Pleurochrysis_carterae.AAC.2